MKQGDNRKQLKRNSFPPLEAVTRPTVPTNDAAYYLNREPQTLRTSELPKGLTSLITSLSLGCEQSSLNCLSSLVNVDILVWIDSTFDLNS